MSKETVKIKGIEYVLIRRQKREAEEKYNLMKAAEPVNMGDMAENDFLIQVKKWQVETTFLKKKLDKKVEEELAIKNELIDLLASFEKPFNFLFDGNEFTIFDKRLPSVKKIPGQRPKHFELVFKSVYPEE